MSFVESFKEVKQYVKAHFDIYKLSKEFAERKAKEAVILKSDQLNAFTEDLQKDIFSRCDTFKPNNEFHTKCINMHVKRYIVAFMFFSQQKTNVSVPI